MNISKLDDFDEGFKVAPRKAHREPVKKGKCPLYGKTRPLLIQKLKEQGLVYLTEFESADRVKVTVPHLRSEGWQIEVIKDGRKAIGYKLIKAA